MPGVEAIIGELMELHRSFSRQPPPIRPGEVDLGEAYSACKKKGLELNLVVSCRRPPKRGYGFKGALLAGVPVAYKDNFHFPGEPTRCGSRHVFSRPAKPAEALARLMANGAYPLARASMDEFGLSVTGYNTFYGNAVNPVNPSRVLGGSTSGGLGLIAIWGGGIALGTDAGGSIRIPSAFTGMYSLKFRRHEVPRGGVELVSPTMEAVGVAAGDTSTLALAAESLRSGFMDEYLLYLEAFEEGLWRPTLYVVEGYESKASPEVVEAFESLVEALGSIDFNVRSVRWEVLWRLDRARATVTLAEAWLKLGRVPGRLLPKPLKSLLSLAARLSRHYATALEVVEAARLRAALLREADMILPATPIDAPPIEEAERMAYSRRLIAYTGLANTLDLSSATLPVAGLKMPSGLPFSAMISGPYSARVAAVATLLSRHIRYR